MRIIVKCTSSYRSVNVHRSKQDANSREGTVRDEEQGGLKILMNNDSNIVLECKM